MDAVATTQQSIQAVNAILQQTSAEAIDMASKMVRVNAEMKLGGGPATATGCGSAIDCYG